MTVDPLDLERLAVRIERLVHTSTHGWNSGDEMSFRQGLGFNLGGGVRTMIYRPNELPTVDFLRQAARSIRAGTVGEGYNPDTLSGIYRNALQVCLRMEDLVRDNDPRNPRKMMRDMARGKFPMMASRIASAHLAVDTGLRGEAQFRGTGQDVGWELDILDVKPLPGDNRYLLECALRWHQYKEDEQGIFFTAEANQSEGRLRDLQWKTQRNWSKDKREAAAIIVRIFGDKSQQTKFWSLVKEKFPASTRNTGYRGNLTIVPMAGKFRSVSGEDVRRYGGSIPFPGRYSPHLEVTNPVSDPDEAERDAKALGKKYEDDKWPGGMSSVVALVLWTDADSWSTGAKRWSGVVNLYYSGS